MNPYLYVLANPINFTDRTGLCTMCTAGSTVTVNDPQSQSIALRERPTLDAPVIGQIPNGLRVTIREGAPVLGSGLDWHSSDIPLHVLAPGAPVIGKVEGWLPNKYLVDDEMAMVGPYPDVPSYFVLQFRAPPVAMGSVTSMQGFGATAFAHDNCSAHCDPNERTSACDYRSTRGLHNGMDFSVPDGTMVYWTSNEEGRVVDEFPRDASDPNNVVIEVGSQRYFVLFGHLSQKMVRLNQSVSVGTPIGSTGRGHLHLGIRTTTRFHNPLYFFRSDLADRLVGLMGNYVGGEGPWSIRSYTYSRGPCLNYYWACGGGCNQDRTGIDRR